jgi:hypothetical protein
VGAEARQDGADSAVLLRATWRDTRRAVLRAGGVADFTFRQYLFACQARVLLRLGRPEEVSRELVASRVQLLLCFTASCVQDRSESSAQHRYGQRDSHGGLHAPSSRWRSGVWPLSRASPRAWRRSRQQAACRRSSGRPGRSQHAPPWRTQVWRSLAAMAAVMPAHGSASELLLPHGMGLPLLDKGSA